MFRYRVIQVYREFRRKNLLSHKSFGGMRMRIPRPTSANYLRRGMIISE